MAIDQMLDNLLFFFQWSSLSLLLSAAVGGVFCAVYQEWCLQARWVLILRYYNSSFTKNSSGAQCSHVLWLLYTTNWPRLLNQSDVHPACIYSHNSDRMTVLVISCRLRVLVSVATKRVSVQTITLRTGALLVLLLVELSVRGLLLDWCLDYNTAHIAATVIVTAPTEWGERETRGLWTLTISCYFCISLCLTIIVYIIKITHDCTCFV